MSDTEALIENIFTVSRIMKANMSYTSGIEHLSILQIQAMVFIRKNKQVQVSELARHFGIELPSATSLLNKLCTMKMTDRNTDKKDRRIVRVTLTSQGEAMLKDAMIERDKKIRKMLSLLSEKDKSDLLRISSLLVEKLEKQYEI